VDQDSGNSGRLATLAVSGLMLAFLFRDSRLSCEPLSVLDLPVVPLGVVYPQSRTSRARMPNWLLQHLLALVAF